MPSFLRTHRHEAADTHVLPTPALPLPVYLPACLPVPLLASPTCRASSPW